jgi:hypothetical protein
MNSYRIYDPLMCLKSTRTDSSYVTFVKISKFRAIIVFVIADMQSG